MLAQCTKGQQQIFKRMYSHKNLILDIEKIVDNMPENKLDWAFTQCEKTLNKNDIFALD